MSFNFIPNIDTTSAMSKITGESSGTTKIVAEKALDIAESQLEALSKKELGNLEAQEELQEIKNTLDQVQAGINAVDSTLNTVKTSADTVSSTLSALKIAASALQAMPLPIPATVTTALMTAQETVTMVDNTVSSLKSVVNSVTDLTTPIKGKLEKLFKFLESLLIGSSLEAALDNSTDKDKKDLRAAGIINDEDRSIFALVSPAIVQDKVYVNYNVGEFKIDTEDPYIKSQIDAAKSGDILEIPIFNAGDSIITIYKDSVDKPDIPTERIIPPTGWSKEQLVGDNIWECTATLSGKTNKVGIWNEPKKQELGLIQVQPEVIENEPLTAKLKVFKINTGDTYPNISNYNMQVVVVIEGEETAYSIISNALDTLANSPLSNIVKSDMNFTKEKLVSSAGAQGTYYYTSKKENITYNIKIKKEDKGISTRQYTSVTDPSGRVVYQGNKTFATDINVLVNETKLKLQQIFG